MYCLCKHTVGRTLKELHCQLSTKGSFLPLPSVQRCRYEVYVQMLEAWSSLKRSSTSGFNANDLGLFDREVGRDTHDEEEDEADGGMKRSHSSPSLELEMAPPPVVKVRRNISERRTYRKIIIPRRNREL